MNDYKDLLPNKIDQVENQYEFNTIHHVKAKVAVVTSNVAIECLTSSDQQFKECQFAESNPSEVR